MYCGSKNKMKSFLIKITPKKDDKSSITDFSDLDVDLANNERNTYKKWWRWGRERKREQAEMSASQVHAGGIKNPTKKCQTTQITKHGKTQTSGILYLAKILTNTQQNSDAILELDYMSSKKQSKYS